MMGQLRKVEKRKNEVVVVVNFLGGLELKSG